MLIPGIFWGNSPPPTATPHPKSVIPPEKKIKKQKPQQRYPATPLIMCFPPEHNVYK